MNVVFRDFDEADMRASRIRVSRKLGRILPALPRYQWWISSKDFVAGDEIQDHLEWIFQLLPLNCRLCDVLAGDYAYWISTFWVGNGTGGGLMISARMADLLSQHRATLGVGFYLEDIVGKD